jgi:hypothetical protein
VYLHAWELDPEQPRIRESVGATVRHRINLRRTEQRLDELCRRFSNSPACGGRWTCDRAGIGAMRVGHCAAIQRGI